MEIYHYIGIALLLGVGLFVWRKLPRQIKIITVVDGDTFIGINRKGRKIKIRLKGVDCPELGQKGGLNAKAFCQNKINKKWVYALFDGVDRYGRKVAQIRYGNSFRRDLGDDLISAGLAYPLKNASFKQKIFYAGAFFKRKGIHRYFFKVKPWTWRK